MCSDTKGRFAPHSAYLPYRMAQAQVESQDICDGNVALIAPSLKNDRRLCSDYNVKRR